MRKIVNMLYRTIRHQQPVLNVKVTSALRRSLAAPFSEASPRGICLWVGGTGTRNVAQRLRFNGRWEGYAWRDTFAALYR